MIITGDQRERPNLDYRRRPKGAAKSSLHQAKIRSPEERDPAIGGGMPHYSNAILHNNAANGNIRDERHASVPWIIQWRADLAPIAAYCRGNPHANGMHTGIAMGLRGEIFSSRVICEGRTYFFNVKQNRMGDLFMSIVESKPTETESFDRRSIVLFKENVQEFLQSFEKALDAMQKTPDSKPPRRSRDTPYDPDERETPRAPAGSKPRTRIVRPRPEGSAPRTSSAPRSHAPRGESSASPRPPSGERRPSSRPSTGDKPAGKRLTVRRAEPKKES